MNEPGWYCPEDFNFTLIGQIWSNTRSNLRISLTPCTNTTATTAETMCAPPETIQIFMANAIWNFAWLANYFDEDEFEEDPMKYEINVSYLNSKQDLSSAYGLAI